MTIWSKFCAEEDGVSAIETVALAAVVLILLTAAIVVLNSPGRQWIAAQLDTALHEQISRWQAGH
ncbi:MAG: hypothetical protein U0350_08690 [Caldilineaceae bacterium]